MFMDDKPQWVFRGCWAVGGLLFSPGGSPMEKRDGGPGPALGFGSDLSHALCLLCL